MSSTIYKFQLLSLMTMILIFQQSLMSQEKNYVIKTYTTENGLANNNVRSIAQDKYGFLWIATWAGLSRYDGIEFRNYYHDPDDSTSLPYFELREVLVDNENNVWIFSQYLSKYNRAEDNFINYEIDCSRESHYQYINNVFVVDARNIWFLCGSGTISKFDSERQTVIEYQYNKNICSEIDRLIVTQDQLFAIKYHYQEIYEFLIDDIHDSLIYVSHYQNSAEWAKKIPAESNYHFGFNKVIQDHNKILFQSAVGTIKVNKKRGIAEAFVPDEKEWQILHKAGINWAVTDNGLLLKPDINAKSILVPKSVTGYIQSCYYDRSGVLWIGGYDIQEQGYGLIAVIPVPAYFKHYLNEYRTGGKISVFSITKDHAGNVWIGVKSMDHLIKIGKDGKVVQCGSMRVKDIKKIEQPRAFLEIGDTNLWIGYFRRLFRKYDYSSGSFSIVKDIKASDGRDFILYGSKLLVKYDNTRIIIGADTILCKFNFISKQVEQTYIVPKSSCMSLYVDKDGTIWAGYDYGYLYHLDGNLRLLENFRICKSNLESICQADDGILWIASLGEGLFRFDTKNKTWNSYNKGDGLVNDVLYNILKDGKGNLWMSSNQGISMFNPRVEQFRNFGLSDGLLIDEFNADAAYLAPDGEMIFGGVGGIVRFYPEHIVEIPYQSSVRLIINNLYVSGNVRHFNKTLYELEKVTLFKGDNNFKVFFNCNDLKNAEKIRYRYMLTHVDKKWIFTDYRNRSVSYAGLSPGSYRFVLEATDPNGDWKYQTSLLVKIPAFYYQTWWFKTSLILVVILLLWIILMQWLRQLRLRYRQMQQALRLEALRGQLNPHFIFNSLNSINYFISKSDRKNANQYIADFARLMRAILNNSTADYISLKKELEAIEDYLKLEHMRFGDKFDFEIVINPGLEVENIEVAPTMLQPFIENSIWHGIRYLEDRKGFICLRFENYERNTLYCSIKDDGIGRKLSAERKSTEQKRKTSKGIQIIMERLNIFNIMKKTNHQIRIEDLFPGREECGTKVSIELPARKEY